MKVVSSNDKITVYICTLEDTDNINDYMEISYDWDLINKKIFSERKESLDKLLTSLS